MASIAGQGRSPGCIPAMMTAYIVAGSAAGSEGIGEGYTAAGSNIIGPIDMVAGRGNGSAIRGCAVMAVVAGVPAVGNMAVSLVGGAGGVGRRVAVATTAGEWSRAPLEGRFGHQHTSGNGRPVAVAVQSGAGTVGGSPGWNLPNSFRCLP